MPQASTFLITLIISKVYLFFVYFRYSFVIFFNTLHSNSLPNTFYTCVIKLYVERSLEKNVCHSSMCWRVCTGHTLVDRCPGADKNPLMAEKQICLANWSQLFSRFYGFKIKATVAWAVGISHISIQRRSVAKHFEAHHILQQVHNKQ